MPTKNTPLLRIDQKSTTDDPRQARVSSAIAPELSTNLTATVETPTNLTAGATYIVYSHVTPFAAQELSWRNADPRTPDTYIVSWSRDSSFTNAVTVSTQNTFITISNLPAATTIYYRVAARIGGQQSQWSSTVSATTAADTSPPAAVSGVQWTWSSRTGDLTITWNPPASANYRDTRVVIRASAGGPVLRETYAVAGRYVWTRAQQAADTNNTYDPSVVVELTARSHAHVFSSTVSVTPTLPPPAPPSGLSASWHSGSCRVVWNIADVDHYRVTINNVTRSVGYVNRYDYTVEQNAIDAGGTANPTLTISVVAVDALNQTSTPSTITTTAPVPAQPSGLTTTWLSDNGTAEADCIISWNRQPGLNYRVTIDGSARDAGQVDRYVYSFDQNRAEHNGSPDPVLTVSLVAVDPFARTSPAATTTATNTAPPSLSAPTVQAFFSSCRFSWSASTARDFLRYELEVRVNGATASVFQTSDTTYTFETTASGSVDARVRVVDRFNQASAWSAFSSTVQLTNAGQFVQELRQGVTYRDSLNNTSATLATLKDSNVSSGGVSYAASSEWRWIEADHHREIRHQTTTLSLTGASVFVATSIDGTTWLFHAGGSLSGNVWVTSSSTSDIQTAQNNAVSLTGVLKIRLPNPVQARFVRLYFRNSSASVTVHEFYPRSVVQADDIAGETLSAISANLGTITAGTITSVSINASTVSGTTITGGTITGTTISGGTITGTTISGGTVTGSTIQTSSGYPRFLFNQTSFLMQLDPQTTLISFRADNQIVRIGGIDVHFFASFTEMYFSFHEDASKVYYMNSSRSRTLGLIDAVSICNVQGDGALADFLIGSLAENPVSTNHFSFPHILFKTTRSSTFPGSMLFYAHQYLFGHPRFRSTTTTSGLLERDTFVTFYAPVSRTVSLTLSRSPAVYNEEPITHRFEFLLETNDNLMLRSYNADGTSRHTIFRVNRNTGHIGFGGFPDVANGAVGSIDVYGDLRVRGRIRAKTNWVGLTVASNWSDYGGQTGDASVAYRVHADNTVELRGVVRLVSATSLLILTLPTEARPSTPKRAAISAWVTSTGNPTGAALHILTNGEVHYNGPGLTLNNNHVMIYCRFSLD